MAAQDTPGAVVARIAEPKMAYIYDDAGNLQDAFLTDEVGFADVEAAAPEGWTVAEDADFMDVDDTAYDIYVDEKEGVL